MNQLSVNSLNNFELTNITEFTCPFILINNIQNTFEQSQIIYVLNCPTIQTIKHCWTKTVWTINRSHSKPIWIIDLINYLNYVIIEPLSLNYQVTAQIYFNHLPLDQNHWVYPKPSEPIIIHIIECLKSLINRIIISYFWWPFIQLQWTIINEPSNQHSHYWIAKHWMTKTIESIIHNFNPMKPSTFHIIKSFRLILYSRWVLSHCSKTPHKH